MSVEAPETRTALRIPANQLERLGQVMTADELFDLVGSRRVERSDEDLVISQCFGFAYRSLP